MIFRPSPLAAWFSLFSRLEAAVEAADAASLAAVSGETTSFLTTTGGAAGDSPPKGGGGGRRVTAAGGGDDELGAAAAPALDNTTAAVEKAAGVGRGWRLRKVEVVAGTRATLAEIGLAAMAAS